MKNLLNVFGIIAITAIIGFGFVTCSDDGGGGTPGDGGNPLQPTEPLPFDNITAAQLVAKIKIGINWGDRLDACDHGEGWMGKDWTVNQMETAWQNPAATKAHFTARKNAGFNAIRIPVTWYKAVDTNYNIRTDWMARVTQVVNYAIENDMYVILNTHHDEHLFKLTNAEIDASLARFKKIWEQIADNFKNYNEKLIFEGLNEPRTIGAAHEWSGNAEEYANLNKYYPVFINAVRNSGGNNDKRNLMISTYAASCTLAAVNALVLPTDTVSNKLIVSIHAYEPFNFAYHYDMNTKTWSNSNPADTAVIHNVIQPAYDKFVSQGIPVIIGEFAAADKNNTSARAQWAEYYVSYAKSKGIPCFWWDNGIPVTSGTDGGMAIFNRENNNQPYPQIITALMNGVNSSGGGNPAEPPNPGSLGDYRYGLDEDGVTEVNKQAVWELSSANVTTAKTTGAKLVLVLNAAPAASLQFVWQGPANNIWWKLTDILGDNGNVLNASHASWNAGTNTLTINMSAAVDYESFKTQTSLNLIIAYYGGSSVDDLGIVSANITQ